VENLPRRAERRQPTKLAPLAGIPFKIRYGNGIKMSRRPTAVAAIALANKLARMAWEMMARNERYKVPALLRRKRDHSRSSGCDVTVGKANST
jgi:hypothetical protein